MFKTLFIYLSLGFTCFSFQSNAQDSKKIVFIILDGISYDVLINVDTPEIDAISKIGGFTKAYVGGERDGYSETPTISAVGYNSLLTGTWVNKHNVSDNDIRRPNYNYWSIFRYVREFQPDKKMAIFSTWEDNRTKLIGEGLKQTGKIALDYSYDGFELDTINFPHDAANYYIYQIDEKVSQEASRYILDNGPDLSWVYLEYPDDMGHQFGDGPELYEAVRQADRQTGEIFNAVQKRMIDFDEDWLIVVTTDHGRQPSTGLHHGGQSDREREIWISTNSKDLNTYFHNQVPGIVDILPSMLRFMEIEIPENQEAEIDGVPLIGPVSVYHPMVKLKDEIVHFSWEFEGKSDEMIEIFVSYGNKFRLNLEGDQYQSIAKVSGNLGSYQMPISQFKGKQFKVLFKGKSNMVNTWLVNKKK